MVRESARLVLLRIVVPAVRNLVSRIVVGAVATIVVANVLEHYAVMDVITSAKVQSVTQIKDIGVNAMGWAAVSNASKHWINALVLIAVPVSNAYA
jgi:hypothetical protein